MALSNLADVASGQGDLRRAASLHRECLRMIEALESPREVAASLEGLAGVLAAQGRAEGAAKFYGAAEALREAIGAPLPANERPEHERKIAAARAGAESGVWETAWEEGRAMALPDAIACALGDSDAQPTEA
jgi:hypothetical protein